MQDAGVTPAIERDRGAGVDPSHANTSENGMAELMAMDPARLAAALAGAMGTSGTGNTDEEEIAHLDLVNQENQVRSMTHHPAC